VQGRCAPVFHIFPLFLLQLFSDLCAIIEQCFHRVSGEKCMTDILNQKVSRRTLLRLGGCAGITVAACGMTGVVLDTQTDVIDRIRGVSHTPVLTNAAAWTYADSTLTLDLVQVPDLAQPNDAVRLEDDRLPEPLLIVHGKDEQYYVFVNRCPHGKRKIDPIDGQLKCTSISSSTFDYSGDVLSGPAEGPLTTYEVQHNGDQLVITLS
jgi:nitrite reductase/ring-hydroxylating ferredoxin subunit